MTYDDIHETAMRAHHLAKGVTILMQDDSGEGRGAAELLMEDLVALTDTLNTQLDSVNRP